MKKMVLHYFGAAVDDSDETAALIVGKIKNYHQNKVVNFYDFNSLIDALIALANHEVKCTVFVWDLKIFFSFIEDDYFSHEFNGISFEEARNGDSGEVYGGTLSINDNDETLEFNFIDLSKIYPVDFKLLGEAYQVNIESLDLLTKRTDSADLAHWEWQAFNDQFLLINKLVEDLSVKNKYRKIKMTRSAMIFNELKKQVLIDDQEYQRYYYQAIFGTKKKPIFSDKLSTLYHTLRHAYYGGFNYLKKDIIGKELGAGIDLDINSLYPYVMSSFNFPVQSSMIRLSKTNFKKLKLNDFANPNLFAIFHLAIYKLELKQGAYPTLPHKSSFIQTESIHDFKNMGEIYISNFDFYHLLLNYNIDFEFVSGIMWTKMMRQPFKRFVDQNVAIKNQASLHHDQVGRLLAKFNLNMCYGKFGQSPLFKTAIPYFDKDEQMTEFEEKLTNTGNMRNITLAIFITSLARHVIFNYIDKIKASPHCEFIYSDTDSVHFLIDDCFQKLSTKQICEQLGLPFDEIKIGSFKEERRFKQAKFIRNKGYVEILENGKIDVVISGLNDNACQTVSLNIKQHGLKYLTLDEPLLVPMDQAIRVHGGTIIRTRLVTINQSDISLKEKLL